MAAPQQCGEYCSLKGIRKATKWHCRDCYTYLCHKGTDTDCFLLYHINHCVTPSLFFLLLHWHTLFYPHLTGAHTNSFLHSSSLTLSQLTLTFFLTGFSLTSEWILSDTGHCWYLMWLLVIYCNAHESASVAS